jgi:soluble P-type ATPase
LAKLKVLVKRLVCIEDLGDIDVLFTDKTGTLTEGRIRLVDGLDAAGAHSEEVIRAGLLATDADPGVGGVSANAMDTALWEFPASRRLMTATVRRIATLPFDHARRATSTLVDDGGKRVLVVKGPPEQVIAHCLSVPAAVQAVLQALFAEGRRVVAVASRPASELTAITANDETSLTLQGFLVFADEPKAAARGSLARLTALGIEVKVATGDNPQVAEKVCADLGLGSRGTVTGAALESLDDTEFEAAVKNNTIFARISPEQKAKLIVAARHTGRSVGFLGDGVNDALALHAADVGISLDSAADVAQDAADVVLLEKDLGVLADGVAEGRRTVANTRVPFFRSRPSGAITLTTATVIAIGVLLTVSPFATLWGSPRCRGSSSARWCCSPSPISSSSKSPRRCSTPARYTSSGSGTASATANTASSVARRASTTVAPSRSRGPKPSSWTKDPRQVGRRLDSVARTSDLATPPTLDIPGESWTTPSRPHRSSSASMIPKMRSVRRCGPSMRPSVATSHCVWSTSSSTTPTPTWTPTASTGTTRKPSASRIEHGVLRKPPASR